jgi:VCBS repeat-containing protein
VTYTLSTGQLTYDPRESLVLQQLRPGESLDDSFTYYIDDGIVDDPLPEAKVRLNIAGINDAPTVADDNVNSPDVPANPLTMDPIIIMPLGNDSDVDGTLDPDSLVVTEQPRFGSVAKRLVTDGSGNTFVELAYSPFANFTGSDSFKYTVSDDLGQQSAEATVTISPSLKPITGADVGGGVAADGININVLENDSPVVGSLDLSSLRIVTGASAIGPNNGTATANADGTISYVPNTGFIGNDVFQYVVSDTEGHESDPVTVTVNSVANRMQNPIRFKDVNASGDVTALDALLIINRINRSGSDSVPVADSDQGPNYYDVNGDGAITALDALLVMNRIGRAAPVFEGESPVTLSAGSTLVMPATSLPRAADVSDAQDNGSQVDLGADVSAALPKLVSVGESADTADWVDDDLVDLLAGDAASDSESESATDLAFKWLR